MVELSSILDSLDLHPILVDVGASGESFPAWETIKPLSRYIGFDPDNRELKNLADSGYHQHHIINSAVTADPESSQIDFYLTEFPYCSSTLKPLTTPDGSVNQYHFAPYFNIIGHTSVPATTLDSAIASLGLDAIHWLKLDTQGTDLRLLKSLSTELFSSLLAIDIEPGLIPFYEGEDVFADAHTYLIDRGFWLSRAEIQGAIRVRPTTLETYSELAEVLRKGRVSPGWVEARYLRRIDTIQSPVEHKLLWLFAIVDDQPGYALDLLGSYKHSFGEDSDYSRMEDFTLYVLRRPGVREEPMTGLKRFIPNRVKHSIKQALKKLIE